MVVMVAGGSSISAIRDYLLLDLTSSTAPIQTVSWPPNVLYRIRSLRDVDVVLFLAAFRFEEKYLFPHCERQPCSRI
jgi:hypothetical protein